MKERPILMNGAMVRATLDGSKTQTRRLIKPAPQMVTDKAAIGWEGDPAALLALLEQAGRGCPYGKPGDHLWVRETFQGPLVDDVDTYRAEPSNFNKPEFCEYAADGGPAPEFMTMDDDLVCRWRPSIHMPRWASRILLEIASVRVERLQAISTEDIIAEGLSTTLREHDAERDLRDQWCALWESTGGDWASNPWLWVISFKRVAP